MTHGPQRDALITGVGIVSARGVGRDAHSGCLNQAPSVPTPLQQFNSRAMPVQVAFQVPRVRPQPFMLRRKDLKLMSRDARLGLQAAGLALMDAGLAPMDASAWPVLAEDVGLFMGVGLESGDIVELGPVAADARRGTKLDLGVLGAQSIDLIPPLSSLKTLPNLALAHVSINLGLMGPGEAISPWGTSGIQAIGAAVESIGRGECEVALVGACDSDVDLGGVSNNIRMGCVARLQLGDVADAMPEGLDGLILGEAAAFFVLESRALAEARGATPVAVIRETISGAGAARSFPSYEPAGLGEVLGRLLKGKSGSVAINSTAGHNRAWRAAEEKILAEVSGEVDLRLLRPVEQVGYCVAASGLVELALMLSSDEGDDPVVAAAWGPSGEWAASFLEREMP